MLDHTEVEWFNPAHGQPVLLYLGFSSDDATVEAGEIAAAVHNGSDGIALYGDREEVLALLLKLAEAVRNAPPVPASEACIGEATDPATWKPGPLTGPERPDTVGWTLCGALAQQPIAADPRLATCSDCVDAFNRREPQTPLRFVHFLPA